MTSVSATKFSAIATMLLGVSAIILPYMFGTLAVLMLAAVMLASGVVGIFYVNAARREGFPVSIFGPWARVIAGIVLLIWPELALWLVALVLGGGLILSSLTGFSALKRSGVVNPPKMKKIELWSGLVLGVLLIVMGAAGSALLLGFILGVSLISSGSQQWRMAANQP